MARNTGHLVDGGQEANINKCIKKILPNSDEVKCTDCVFNKNNIYMEQQLYFFALHDICSDIFNLFRVDHSTEESVTFALQTPDRI